jgi:membrane associated rhomboid family serine protease
MFRSLTPVVRALLYTNLIVYVLETLTGDTLLDLFALWPLNSHSLYGAPPFEPWQLVSYAFLHGGWLHLFSNMLALYMFGPDSERVLGSGRFTQYYFACVIGAALTQMFVMRVVDPGPSPTLGASGGIFGVLLFYGMAFPRRKILLLFPPIPMPAWLFVTLYGIFELVQGVFGTAQGVAHFAHLGGLATGFLVILYWRRQGPREL